MLGIKDIRCRRYPLKTFIPLFFKVLVLYNLVVVKGKRVEPGSFAHGFDLGNSFRSCSYLNVKLNKMLRTYMYNVVGDHIKVTIKKSAVRTFDQLKNVWF